MTDLARLDYAALSACPADAEVAAYRSAAQAVPGYSEAKAPGGQGNSGDSGLWLRRCRLGAFAQSNGMTYAFRGDPRDWPGNVAADCTMLDVLQGVTQDGARFMACAQQIARKEWRVTGKGGSQLDSYVVVAVRACQETRAVFLRHTWTPQAGATDLLEAHYRLDDPYVLRRQPRGKDRELALAKCTLTPGVADLLVREAPGYDLLLAGGWLYLMKPAGFASVVDMHADSQLLRERFEIAAQLGPELAWSWGQAESPGR